MRCVSSTLLLTAVLMPATISLAVEAVTVLRFRQVWDGDRLLPNASVVIQGQRIIAVGTTVDVPKGAREVDLRRFTALPGLIDLHTHVTYFWDWRAGNHAAAPRKAPHSRRNGRRRRRKREADARNRRDDDPRSRRPGRRRHPDARPRRRRHARRPEDVRRRVGAFRPDAEPDRRRTRCAPRLTRA